MHMGTQKLRCMTSFKIISYLLKWHLISVDIKDIGILFTHMSIGTTRECVIWKSDALVAIIKK